MSAPEDPREQWRKQRRHSENSYRSNRAQYERDCDRILYCSAWPRLGNITQILSPTQGSFFHNRLTHSLKVAQIGRRIAEKLLLSSPQELILECGGLSPDVVEAAGKAHDLGHPPFGHIGEQALNDLVTKEHVAGGFEGNAQSFRVLTKLSYRQSDFEGLNLTRATLNSVLKYPWFRGTTEGDKKNHKWGASESEKADFEWAREGLQLGERRSLEAEIMDFADEIAYSIYDLDDFYRAGFIPLHLLFSGGSETLSEEAESFFKILAIRKKLSTGRRKELEVIFLEMAEWMVFRPYKGTKSDRSNQRDRTAYQVFRYIDNVAIRNDGTNFLDVSQKTIDEIFLLKEITWHYIIESSRLLVQQSGQRQIIESVFSAYLKAAKAKNYLMFPPMQRELLELNHQKDTSEQVEHSEMVRIVVDMVAGLTESQIIEIHQHLTGYSTGFFRAPIV